MKNNKLIIIKRVLLLLLFFCLFLLFNFDYQKDAIGKPKPNLVVEEWSGEITDIYDITDNTDSAEVMDYVYFIDFVNNINHYYQKDKECFRVVIESSIDFQRLSMLMNGLQPSNLPPITKNPTWFLELNYLIGKDIDFTGQSIYPIGNNKYSFEGSFDGQGFSLSNLHLRVIDDALKDGDEDYFNEIIEYYALFSCVGTDGVIKNIRLVDPQASQADSFSTNVQIYTAPLAGLNKGVIENCSITVEEGNTSFITPSSFIVSTMICRNQGIFKNSFVAVPNGLFESEINEVLNIAYPVLYENENVISNVYYDGELFIREVTEFDPDIIELLTADFQKPASFATDFVNNWFFNTSYSDVVLSDDYPILHGLTLYGDSLDTYEINRAVDLFIFSDLLNRSEDMASRNYILTKCIDMDSLARDIYVAPLQTFFGTLSSEIVDLECDHNHNISSADPKYHSIWNLKTLVASSYDQITCYSLVNQLAGSIKNINLVNFQSILNNASTYSTNIIHTGSIVGYVLANGIIDNVNVYGSIELPNSSSSSRYGAIYIGGLVGHNSGTIKNSSFAGKIDGGVHYPSTIASSNSIGGIVGFSDGGNYQKLKNTARIIGLSFSTENSTNTSYLGGIIGFGEYLSLKEVVNKGLIISHSNSGYLRNTYIGGIISILSNPDSETEKTFNNGEIRLIVKNSNYIDNYFTAGFGTISTKNRTPRTKITVQNIVNNANIQIATSYEESNGQYSFGEDFSDHDKRMSSGGTTVNPTSNIGGSIKITGCIIIDVQTHVDIKGVFQNATQTVDLGILYRYAPVIFSLNESSSYDINVSQSYNKGDINFITTHKLYNQKISITGNTYGDYINFDYLRNEGDLYVKVTKLHVSNFVFKLEGSNTDYSANFRISGLIGTLENGYHIYNSYNGGNIRVENWSDDTSSAYLKSTETVTLKTATLQYMLYIGGIAFRNNNVVDVEPKNNVIISSSRKGAIHNCLNDGKISVDLSLYGCSRFGGITAINNGLISTSFNTGDIYNYTALYIDPNGNGDIGGNNFEVEAGGITCMIGSDTGQIMDCANYGEITCISPTDRGNGWLNSGGIVGRNEKREDNLGNPEVNWSGKIQFCANYGDIYAWNAFSENFGNFVNGTGSSNLIGAESSCKAAGIIAIGVLNVINCVNYGNIYSRYLAGGIFGLVDGTKFRNINNNVYIANSINYGSICRISSFNSNKTFSIAENLPSPRSININNRNYYINPMYGGGIGYIYATNSWSRDGLVTSSEGWDENDVNMLQYLLISFLINFDENVNIIGSQTLYKQTNSLGDSASKKYAEMVKYMATTKGTDQSMYPFNSTNYHQARYQGVEYSVPEYNLSANLGGIFGDDFPLRSGNLDDSIVTNDYVRNYISFVEYQYTNTNLVNNFNDKVGNIGIYAVASSKGILNGKYIPDNVIWGTKDEPGLDPIENGEVDSSWRGEIDDQESVNYKFIVGMKQLNKSIAGTVYDLDLNNVDDTSLIIDAPMIDIENRIITFYVGDNEAIENPNINQQKLLTISNPEIDYNQKTITYRYGGQIYARYSYSEGKLKRIDNKQYNVVFNQQSINSLYQEVDQYIAGSISDYYVTKNNGSTYQRAGNSDILYAITVSSSSNYNYRWYRQSSGYSGYYNYTSSYTSSGRDYILVSELTNRSNLNQMAFYTQGVNNFTVIGVGTQVPANYKLYQETVKYPSSIDVYSGFFESLYKVNTDYENLSENAHFDLGSNQTTNANNVRVSIPENIGEQTTSIGKGDADYLYIVSEAGVKTRYEIRVERIADKELSNLQIRLNGQTISHQNGVIQNELEKTSHQTLDISYVTINIPDKQDLLRNTSLLKYNDSISDYDIYEDFSYYDLSGGEVINITEDFNEMRGEYESAPLGADGKFPNGTVSLKLEFYNLISEGSYCLKTSIGSVDYDIYFVIKKSNIATIEEMKYNDDFTGASGTWVNSGNQDQLINIIRYDLSISSYFTAMVTDIPMYWENISLEEDVYLEDLTISPYATLTSIDYQVDDAKDYASTILNLIGVNYANDSNGSQVYIITYTFEAEDETEKTFTHYFVEELLDISVQYIYMDGINQGTENEVEFMRTNQPLIKAFYDFESIDPEKHGNLSLTIAYDYDTYVYPKTSGGEDNALILASISSINISNNGISVTFGNDVACLYTIRVGYTREGSSSWDVEYQEFIINKTNNTDSSLNRVLFYTDSPATSLWTIIYNGHQIIQETEPTINIPETTETVNQPLLTPSIYEILSENEDLRIIKPMPNRIYYNNEHPRKLQDPDNASVKYNRYDVVGLVSKTDLSSFTPAFTLPVGAVIYQLDEDNKPILNTNQEAVLEANFVDDSGGAEFKYVHYRIYSEASPKDSNGFFVPNDNNDNYTDYYISILDASYNVYFSISFDFSDDVDILDELRTNNPRILVNFLRFQEQYIGDDSVPVDEISIISSIFYFLNGPDDTITTYEHNLGATASGFFLLKLNLPKGYDYTYTLSSDSPLTVYGENDYFYIISSMFAKRYYISITVSRSDTIDEWGQNGKIEIDDSIN